MQESPEWRNYKILLQVLKNIKIFIYLNCNHILKVFLLSNQKFFYPSGI